MVSNEFRDNGDKYQAASIMAWMEELLNNKVVQIGGNATLGKGMVKTKLTGGNNHE